MSRATGMFGRVSALRARGHLGPLEFALLGFTLVAFSAATASFAVGVYCYTQPDPGADCAVLIAILPLLLIPLGVITTIFGAARAGWLVRDEPDQRSEQTRDGDADGDDA